MFCPGRQKWHGMFCPGDKNCMRCFVRGGKLMRDVLSAVAKNGMGCFVPGCFVLHRICTPTEYHQNISKGTKSLLSTQAFPYKVHSSEITQTGSKGEQPFSHTTHRICLPKYQHILKGIKVIKCTSFRLRTDRIQDDPHINPGSWLIKG